MLRRAYFAVVAVLLLGGCGGPQGAPDFQQMFSAVDDPCPASTTPSTACTAHVVLVNHGGEGNGHATIAVSLKDATAPATSARVNSAVRCAEYIPDTPAGGVVDLTCTFDLPAGKKVASLPAVQSLDFTGALGSSSSTTDTTDVATFALAVLAAVLSLIALLAALVRRRSAGGARPALAEEPSTGDGDGGW